MLWVYYWLLFIDFLIPIFCYQRAAMDTVERLPTVNNIVVPSGEIASTGKQFCTHIVSSKHLKAVIENYQKLFW